MENVDLIIDGKSVSSSRSLEVTNPADLSEVVGRAPDASPEEVDAAVQAAATAFPEWSARPVEERAQILLAAGEAIKQVSEDMVALLMREHGKVGWECHVDLEFAAGITQFTASIAADTLADCRIHDTGGTTLIRRKPLGPVAAIVPWNFPVVLGFMKIAPALLAGNTVVVKPSDLVPLTLSRVVGAIQEFFPGGVLSLVSGADDTGAALVEHPLIRKVAFTGGTETGKKVMRAAADGLKRVTLELGGNDPAIVLDEDELPQEMIDGLVRGVYTSTGTVCFAIKRIYVPERAYARFVDQFCEAVDRIAVGPSSDPRSTIGPMKSEEQLRFVEKLLDQAQSSGAVVRQLGTMVDPASWDKGLFMLPTVVTDVAPEALVVTEEQFGPTVPILSYHNIDEVLRTANDTPYGLCASLWTRNEDRAFELGRRIEAGSVFINSHTFESLDPRAPFGGVKSSGIGREFGPYAFDSYTEYQVISRRTGPPGAPVPD